MGDMGDIFNEHKKDRQEKRASNRKSSANILRDAGVSFERKNMGAHLIVNGGECKIDFWPGTGRWMSRNGKGGRGVRSLIEYIN